MALSTLLRGLLTLIVLLPLAHRAPAERIGFFVFKDDNPTTMALTHHLRRIADQVDAVVAPEMNGELQRALSDAAEKLNLKVLAQAPPDPERIEIPVHEVPPMHIGELRVISSNAGGGRRRGRVLATVHDGDGSPIPGAAVTGTFEGSFEEDITAISGHNGRASLVTSLAVRLSVDYAFCVTDVWHPEYYYDPTADAESCGRFKYVMPTGPYYSPP